MDRQMHVLHVSPDMNAGGIENFIMNIYRNIDRDRYQFDFLLHHSYESVFEPEIRELGGRVYKYPVLENKNVVGYYEYVKRLFESHPEINVAHSHMCSLAAVFFKAAKVGGCNVRICHSHNTSHDKTFKGYLKYWLSRLAPKDATAFFACSTEAGLYLFGNRQFNLIHNAIDTDRFSFKHEYRDEIRECYQIGEEFLVGNIGRLAYQKNHRFLVSVFAEVLKLKPESKLMLVGIGEDEEKIRNLVISGNMENSVIFVHGTSAPEKYYSAFDTFVMPSLFEGLPLAGIEAQCSGLPCFFSEAVTQEVGVTKNATFLPLTIAPHEWAIEICKASAQTDRQSGPRQIREAGYDAQICAQALCEFYSSKVKCQ